MASDLTFSGERFLPACAGEIAYEHWHRYAFARHYVEGRRVLDAACGEGYGTALLGTIAAGATGVDIDRDTVLHAQARYGSDRVRFVESSCIGLALPDASFDVVVSFETIEHLEAPDQPRMLSEFSRVLKSDGLLVISSPNKHLYSDERDHHVNEFHRHELYRDDLAALLAAAFPAQRWFHQRVLPWSTIWSEGTGDRVDAWIGDAAGDVVPYAPGDGMYFIVVAARTKDALPAARVRGSLFSDAEETELKRAQANEREVLRLDALLKDRDAALGRESAHVHHLETLLAEHEKVIATKDDRLEELDAVRQQREKVIAQRDRELADRERTVVAVENRADALARERARQDDAMTARIAAFETERTALRHELARRQTLGWWLWAPWRRLGRALFQRDDDTLQ